MEYKITMAEICDLAHQFTLNECNEKGIVVDGVSYQCNDVMSYSSDAQTIFDKYYNLITETLGV